MYLFDITLAIFSSDSRNISSLQFSFIHIQSQNKIGFVWPNFIAKLIEFVATLCFIPINTFQFNSSLLRLIDTQNGKKRDTNQSGWTIEFVIESDHHLLSIHLREFQINWTFIYFYPWSVFLDFNRLTISFTQFSFWFLVSNKCITVLILTETSFSRHTSYYIDKCTTFEHSRKIKDHKMLFFFARVPECWLYYLHISHW